MEENKIKAAITRIFNDTDKRRWDIVHDSFADEVLLDYSSMNGQPATTLKADEIINSWKEFLPKFKFTFHTLTNFEFYFLEENCNVFCKGSAMHYLPGAEGGDLWTVYGTYDFELKKINGEWKVTAMKFNLLYQERK